MAVRRISQAQARRFVLLRQGLLGNYRYYGVQGVIDFTLSAGCVQYDPMDGALYARCRQVQQLSDLCGCDGDEAAFFAHGLGVVALHGQGLAGGASAYAWDDAGIEVEIDTLPPFRRQGVAAACGAALILRCLAAHRRVHWDAANPISARLAERLGFLPRGEYAVIEWR